MTTTTSPKQFSSWPYAIIGYFIVFITGVAVFITWAVTQDMDLVRKDYYDHEILFQQQIDRQKRTAELGAQAAVNHDAARQALTVQIPASHVAGASGTINFYRPSDAKLDQAVRLAPAADGTQQINVQSLRSGLWKVAVQWTADGQEYHLDRSIVIGG
jgi:nitrogen fixation protein FixH